jgi:hypothetical protein
MSFGMAFACKDGKSDQSKSSNGDSNQSQNKRGDPSQTANGDLIGKWTFRAIINPGGSERILNNSESYVEFRSDGEFQKQFGAYPNWSQSSGTYRISGSRLTMDDSTYGGEKVYTMKFGAGGNTLTIVQSDGSGYRLEK